MNNKKTFDIILNGVGGQGLITLLQIMGAACLNEGYDVKSSELHGLSQRGGSVETFLRFGKKVYSPIVAKGEADLIIGLESLEGLRGYNNARKDTVFLINKYSLPYIGGLSQEELDGQMKNISHLHIVEASEICKKELGNEVVSGIYLLGYAINKKLIPLKSESVLKAIEQTIPQKYLDLNIKAFELARK